MTMTDAPTPEQKLQAFLEEEKLTLLPTLVRIEPAGAGRFLIDLGVSISAQK